MMHVLSVVIICGHHSQIIILCTLNLYSAVCQLCV